MTRFNRLLVLGALLAAIAGMPITVVLVLFYRAPLGDALINVVRALFADANAFSTQVVCAGGATMIFAVSIVLLFFELRDDKRLLRVRVSEGQVEMSCDALAARLQGAILSIADVTQAKPRVMPRTKELVDLMLELEIAPNVIVPEKTQEVIAAAKQVIEHQLGFKVGAIKVRLDHPRPQKKNV